MKNAEFGRCVRRGSCSTTSPANGGGAGARAGGSLRRDSLFGPLSDVLELPSGTGAVLPGALGALSGIQEDARDMLFAVERLFALWRRFRGEAGERLLLRKEFMKQSIPAK